MGHISGIRGDAACRHGDRIPDDFPEAFRFKAGGAEEIRPEATGFAFGLQRSIGKLNEVCGIVACPGHGIKSDAISNQLLLTKAFCAAPLFDPGSVVFEEIPLADHILAITQMGDAEFAQPARYLNGNLMSSRVADFMPD